MLLRITGAHAAHTDATNSGTIVRGEVRKSSLRPGEVWRGSHRSRTDGKKHATRRAIQLCHE